MARLLSHRLDETPYQVCRYDSNVARLGERLVVVKVSARLDIHRLADQCAIKSRRVPNGEVSTRSVDCPRKSPLPEASTVRVTPAGGLTQFRMQCSAAAAASGADLGWFEHA